MMVGWVFEGFEIFIRGMMCFKLGPCAKGCALALCWDLGGFRQGYNKPWKGGVFCLFDEFLFGKPSMVIFRKLLGIVFEFT